MFAKMIANTDKSMIMRMVVSMRVRGFATSSHDSQPRSKIMNEINNSPIAQFRQMLDTKGKIFKAEKCDFSVSLPKGIQNLKGKAINLNEFCRGSSKLTLATICFSNFSHDMIESFSDPWKEWMKQDDRLAYLDLKPINGWLRWTFYGWLAKMDERKYLDEEYHDRCIVFKSSKKWMEEWRLTNGLGAYAYLLDDNAQVRWRASGYAEKDELNALTDMIGKLPKNSN